jgi:hypothetical protein
MHDIPPYGAISAKKLLLCGRKSSGGPGLCPGSWAKNALNSKSSAAPLEKSTKRSGLRRMHQQNEANQPGTQTTTPKFSMEKEPTAPALKKQAPLLPLLLFFGCA